MQPCDAPLIMCLPQQPRIHSHQCSKLSHQLPPKHQNETNTPCGTPAWRWCAAAHPHPMPSVPPIETEKLASLHSHLAVRQQGGGALQAAAGRRWCCCRSSRLHLCLFSGRHGQRPVDKEGILDDGVISRWAEGLQPPLVPLLQPSWAGACACERDFSQVVVSEQAGMAAASTCYSPAVMESGMLGREARPVRPALPSMLIHVWFSAGLLSLCMHPATVQVNTA